MKSGEILAFGAVVAIILIALMNAMNTRTGAALNWLFTGNGQTQQISAPASGTSVVGGPSLSAQKVDTILSNAGSPAAGSGQTFYQDSITYNIPDEIALAFFHHESTYGLHGAASATHSIGNIVCTAGYSCIGRFRAYASWSQGIDDWYQLLSGPAYAGGGLKTLDQVIPKYAPASDGNSETSYIQAVQADVSTWRQS